MKENSTGYSITDRDRKFDYKELGIALLVFVVLGLTGAIALILIRQNNNQGIIKENNQNNQILVDCNTPGHPCYERNAQNRKNLLIITTYCGNHNDTIKSITICVNKYLNKEPITP